MAKHKLKGKYVKDYLIWEIWANSNYYVGNAYNMLTAFKLLEEYESFRVINFLGYGWWQSENIRRTGTIVFIEGTGNE